ncbi:hypothetical protein F8388_000070 [Cannabis sativa]|nr:hypothetical protein F8388_000070 [Cannabis sativa]KAF4386071.1 hypothetical protein G4B88_031206 [Cannabis sativa]
MACKPCLDKGRQAIDRSLNPDYDPDDEDENNADLRAPLNPNPNPDLENVSTGDQNAAVSSSTSDAIKAV